MAAPLGNLRQRKLQPMQVNRASHYGEPDLDLLPVPQRIPVGPVAPDWRAPTEDNGLSAPRDTLHIALVVQDLDLLQLLRRNVYVIKPPLWKGGKVELHIIPGSELTKDEITVRIAMADLGLVDSRDLEIGPPDKISSGYPSGDNHATPA